MMTMLADALAKKWVEGLTDEDRLRMSEVANGILDFLRKIDEAANFIAGAAIRAARKAEIDHDRAALLSLYRTRHKWKKADLARLKTYGLNNSARRRMSAIAASKLLGPGFTVPYQPLVERLAEVVKYLIKLFDPATPAHERLRLLKHHDSWWPQFIEMTYRGEYRRLKKLRVKAASDQAEQSVADVFCISCSTVRRVCVQVRKDLPSHDLMSSGWTVNDIKIWKESGCVPEPEPENNAIFNVRQETTRDWTSDVVAETTIIG